MEPFHARHAEDAAIQVARSGKLRIWSVRIEKGSAQMVLACLKERGLCPRVRTIEITHSGLARKADFSCFSELTQARRLIFYNNAGQNGFESFQELSGLQRVEICHEEFSVSALAGFSKLPNLRVLDFGGSSALGGNFAAIRSLSTLQQLRLYRCGLFLDDLRSFNGLPNLKQFDLQGNVLADLSELDFPNLESLNLRSCKIGDVNLPSLERLQQLKVLYLAGNRITDGGIITFPRLQNLEVLDLRKNRLTDRCLGHFGTFVHLKKLALRGNSVTSLGSDHSRAERPSLTIYS